MGEESEPKAPKTTSSGWKHASWVSTVGKLAWIIVLVNAIIGITYYLIVLVGNIIWNATHPFFPAPLFFPVWSIAWGVIIIILDIIIIKPKFSNKCAAMDWDALYGWVLNLGKLRFPWMLFWGFFIEIFGLWGWGGVLILIPAFVLLFAGPEKYEWSK
ncbi:MAG: hypothetical protein ACFFBH_11455 [Promethearchaeota archaeon]